MIIYHAIAQRCAPEGDWLLSTPERFWLTLKFVLCYLLRLKRRESLPLFSRYVTVAQTDQHKWSCEWGECYDWTSWRVGKGVLSNWWYMQDLDGAP